MQSETVEALERMDNYEFFRMQNLYRHVKQKLKNQLNLTVFSCFKCPQTKRSCREEGGIVRHGDI